MHARYCHIPEGGGRAASQASGSEDAIVSLVGGVIGGQKGEEERKENNK